MPDDAESCIKCGTKLPAGSAVQQPDAAQTDTPKKAKKKKSKLPIILGVAILLIVVVIVIAVSLGGNSGSNIDYIATAKAHTPFATSQNLPYTYSEVFSKYTTNLVWETASEDKKTDTATVKADGILKGTDYRLIVSIKVSPNPNNSNSCLIQPQSVNFNGIASADQNCAVDFLYIMFAAYGEGFEDLSEVLSDLDAVSALLTGSGISGQQINTELSETYANTDMGISFRYPNDWMLMDESEVYVSLSTSIINDTSGFSASFGVFDLTEAYANGTLGIDVFTDDVVALEEAYSQQGNTTVLSIEDVTINGIPARVLKYQAGGLNGTDPVITRDYYINMGRVYRIVCSCNKSIADAYDEVYDAILGSFTITLTEEPATEPSQSVEPSKPPQNGPPANPGPSDFVGTWIDTTSTYQMEITYDSLYSITISQNLSSSEWNVWHLEGAYEQNFGIFCWGTYVEQYLRDDGTVGLNGMIDDIDDVIYFGDDGLLHWNDSLLGLPEIRFVKQ